MCGSLLWDVAGQMETVADFALVGSESARTFFASAAGHFFRIRLARVNGFLAGFRKLALHMFTLALAEHLRFFQGGGNKGFFCANFSKEFVHLFHLFGASLFHFVLR